MSLEYYSDTFLKTRKWILQSIDDIRNHLTVLTYPIFVYLYIELIKKSNINDAKEFLNKYRELFPNNKEEITELSLIKIPISVENPSKIIVKYLKNRVHVYIPKIIFDVFIHYLTTHHSMLILEILNKYFAVSSLLSKVKENNSKTNNDNFVMLNLTADDIDKINSQTGIYTAKVKKDNETFIKIGNKKNKGEKNLLSKVLIPIPEQYYDTLALDSSLIKIDSKNPPTIGCFTVLNSHNKMNCCDFTSDGSLISVGLKNGQIYLWVLNKDFPEDISEDLIKELEEHKDTHYSKMLKGGEITFDIDPNIIKPNNEEEEVNAFDYLIKKRRYYVLNGHSDAVYSVSFSPDNKYLVSGSFDESIRLWSTLSKQVLVLYKGHFSPVLQVKFSPLCHYFASSGCDRTAKIWSISNSSPLRQFSGHLSDVELIEFHPNGLYLATAANDKTVRLWCIESGDCVRVIYNYSEKGFVDNISFTNSGKIMAIASDNMLIIYDLMRMGDPIRIIENFSSNPIYSICFDSEDTIIVASTEEHEILFFDFDLLLNDQLPIRIDLNNYKNDSKFNFMYQYLTKKTPILNMKFNSHNVLLTIGRFDDNDPKIFM